MSIAQFYWFSSRVVAGDIPDNVVAFGNPCRVYRQITENDKLPKAFPALKQQR